MGDGGIHAGWDHGSGIVPGVWEMACGLRGEDGLVVLDTVGNVPEGGGNPVSVVAARPVRVIRGSIHRAEDRRELRDAWEAGVAARPETGGLCGWIDYDGAFVFGDYPEMLCYEHARGSWSGSGSLAASWRAGGADGEPVVGGFSASMTRAGYVAAVERAKEWIAAGDIYQVNLSWRMEAEVAGPPLWSLYRELRACSPAPMGAWISLAGREVLSSSPELFLRVSGRRIETRPIKGTRPRFADPAEDRRSADELCASEKEAAELIMITDLLRNDLGRVCGYGTVRVEDLLRLESLGQVHHLVSTVSGGLRGDCDAIDALAACFPGGSITGAPKVRAMQIIGELETVPRGLYCGAIGWLSFSGDACFNIAIRTLVREGGRLSYHVGAGIVADSDPEREYEETEHKAEGIRLALDRWRSREGV